ncbi:hypothetical protein ARMSODRAFT_1083378 [Armillaria solidipes]|uniref:Protein kinase domain-containing protein n=1 Tax=Armillaria solidipes TaxID=1076256 RepID=A0A2H3BNA2_9AGAR|nr:hypothetical protein ARMSODRAFT_1083378 [Armillaria solidipes]
MSSRDEILQSWIAQTSKLHSFLRSRGYDDDLGLGAYIIEDVEFYIQISPKDDWHSDDDGWDGDDFCHICDAKDQYHHALSLAITAPVIDYETNTITYWPVVSCSRVCGMDSLQVEDVFIVKVVGHEFKARWGSVLPRMVPLTIPELNAEHGFDPAREGADVCEYFGWPLLEILDSPTGEWILNGTISGTTSVISDSPDQILSEECDSASHDSDMVTGSIEEVQVGEALTKTEVVAVVRYDITTPCRLTSSASPNISLPWTGDDLYRPGMTLNLKFQPSESSEYTDLAATVVKHFESFTSAAVLLVQRHSDNEQVVLKLGDRRLGKHANKGDVELLWTSSIDDRLRCANRPSTELWEDWMWEVCTWIGKMSNHDTELSAYRLLHRLQGRYISRLFGVVRLRITSESTPLHPITDVVEGLVLEYIPGISIDKLKPSINVSEQEAERNSSAVLEGFRAIEAENCLLHSDIHTRNIVLREGNWSPVIIDFGLANIREPEYSDSEEWESVVHGGPDTHYIRRLLVDPEDVRWKRTVTPFEMSDWHYNEPLAFNKYVESMPNDFRMATFDRVLDTDWERAGEKVYQWRIKPGVRCRPSYDCD